jgi:hypothetical protein
MEKKVNVYAKTAEGTWVLLYKNIDEKIASDIWMAGFRTGENRISIEDDEAINIRELNRRILGIKG